MIVVDSNVLAYLYLPGEYTDAAESLLENDPNWAAPPSSTVEPAEGVILRPRG